MTARTYDQLAGGFGGSEESSLVLLSSWWRRITTTGWAGYHSWWDVPIAEVSESQAVQEARAAYVEAVKKERYFWPAPQTQPEELPANAEVLQQPVVALPGKVAKD